MYSFWPNRVSSSSTCYAQSPSRNSHSPQNCKSRRWGSGPPWGFGEDSGSHLRPDLNDRRPPHSFFSTLSRMSFSMSMFKVGFDLTEATACAVNNINEFQSASSAFLPSLDLWRFLTEIGDKVETGFSALLRVKRASGIATWLGSALPVSLVRCSWLASCWLR